MAEIGLSANPGAMTSRRTEQLTDENTDTGSAASLIGTLRPVQSS
jgi:hypothetical protein